MPAYGALLKLIIDPTLALSVTYQITTTSCHQLLQLTLQISAIIICQIQVRQSTSADTTVILIT